MITRNPPRTKVHKNCRVVHSVHAARAMRGWLTAELLTVIIY